MNQTNLIDKLVIRCYPEINNKDISDNVTKNIVVKWKDGGYITEDDLSRIIKGIKGLLVVKQIGLDIKEKDGKYKLMLTINRSMPQHVYKILRTWVSSIELIKAFSFYAGTDSDSLSNVNHALAITYNLENYNRFIIYGTKYFNSEVNSNFNEDLKKTKGNYSRAKSYDEVANKCIEYMEDYLVKINTKYINNLQYSKISKILITVLSNNLDITDFSIPIKYNIVYDISNHQLDKHDIRNTIDSMKENGILSIEPKNENSFHVFYSGNHKYQLLSDDPNIFNKIVQMFIKEETHYILAEKDRVYRIYKWVVDDYNALMQVLKTVTAK